MSDDATSDISPTRLRIGTVLIFLWWVPIWAIAPQLADMFGFDSNNARIVIMIIQTIIGLIGMLIVGKQIAGIMKGTSFRRMPSTVWKVLRHGSISQA